MFVPARGCKAETCGSSLVAEDGSLWLLMIRGLYFRGESWKSNQKKDVDKVCLHFDRNKSSKGSTVSSYLHCS